MALLLLLLATRCMSCCSVQLHCAAPLCSTVLHYCSTALYFSVLQLHYSILLCIMAALLLVPLSVLQTVHILYGRIICIDCTAPAFSNGDGLPTVRLGVLTSLNKNMEATSKIQIQVVRTRLFLCDSKT